MVLKVSTTVEHFGEKVRPGKYGHRLTRELYAIPNKTPSSRVPRWMTPDVVWEAEEWAYEDEDHTRLSDAFCAQQREEALLNFDQNMAFFAQIPADAFDSALNEMLRKNPALRPVTDIRAWDGDVAGSPVLPLVIGDGAAARLQAVRDIDLLIDILDES